MVAKFNRKAYGEALRSWRKQAGYKSADQMAYYVKMRYNVPMTAGALYKIEHGVQAPNLDQYRAFYLATHGEANIYEAMMELPKFFRDERR